MTTREKVIISMAGAALLYGLYTLFSKPEVLDAPPTGSSTAAVVMAKTVLTDKPADATAINQVLVNAQLPWQDNSFLIVGLDHKKETDSSTIADIPVETKNISYSGYLEMAGERIAIINNSEYREGETVEGFIIEKITSAQIRLTREKKGYAIAFSDQK